MNKVAAAAIFVSGLSISASTQTNSDNWPQWRGPNRDGHLVGFVAPKTWPERLPPRHWQIYVGPGYATPLLVEDRIYMFSRLGENEAMQAIDARSSNILWRTTYPAPVQDGQSRRAARTRAEIDAGLCRRQAVLDRHGRT
jgi:hypothetical protein